MELRNDEIKEESIDHFVNVLTDEYTLLKELGPDVKRYC